MAKNGSEGCWREINSICQLQSISVPLGGTDSSRRSHSQEVPTAALGGGADGWSVWAEGEALPPPTAYLPSRRTRPSSLATLRAWYRHSLDKHSSTMRKQTWVFSPPRSSNKEPRNALGFWILMPSCKFVFNLGFIPGTRRSFSKNRQRGEKMWRKEGWKEGRRGGDCG